MPEIDTQSELDQQFEEVWKTAEEVFKNNKEDAKYFWLLGRLFQVDRQQPELRSLLRKVQ